MKEDLLADSHPDHPANATQTATASTKAAPGENFLKRAEAAQADRAKKVKALVTLAVHSVTTMEPDHKFDDKWREQARQIAGYIVDAVTIVLRPGHDKLYALEAAAKQFRHYQTLHAAKGTADGDAKAAVNANFATLCEQALVE